MNNAILKFDLWLFKNFLSGQCFIIRFDAKYGTFCTPCQPCLPRLNYTPNAFEPKILTWNFEQCCEHMIQMNEKRIDIWIYIREKSMNVEIGISSRSGSNKAGYTAIQSRMVGQEQ